MGIFNWTDETRMTFGKYKGEKMANVPDDYLIYLYNKDWVSGGLKEYIEENLGHLIDKTDEKGVEL